MKVAHTIAEARAALQQHRAGRQTTLGLVPTMGALHEGHLSLVRAARSACDHVAVSLFVNPTQFGPNEDLARYPRPFEQDVRLLETEGVDLLFAPAPEEMYPRGGMETSVDPGELGNRLDGASRPGHFRGVCTVVSKLFHILTPDRAYFGQKDAAQVAVLRAMVRDLNFGLTMVVCPTVRDSDGLALSSRNRYLSAAERQEALALSQALRCAAAAFMRGERRPEALVERMRGHLASPGLRLDYVAAVDADTLLPVAEATAGTLLAVAAFVGKTRLIDNLVLGNDRSREQ